MSGAIDQLAAGNSTDFAQTYGPSSLADWSSIDGPQSFDPSNITPDSGTTYNATTGGSVTGSSSPAATDWLAGWNSILQAGAAKAIGVAAPVAQPTVDPRTGRIIPAGASGQQASTALAQEKQFVTLALIGVILYAVLK